jgi:hypothetical protein
MLLDINAIMIDIMNAFIVLKYRIAKMNLFILKCDFYLFDMCFIELTPPKSVKANHSFIYIKGDETSTALGRHRPRRRRKHHKEQATHYHQPKHHSSSQHDPECGQASANPRLQFQRLSNLAPNTNSTPISINSLQLQHSFSADL